VKFLQSSLVVCACLFDLGITPSFAQELPPIGKHYANTITIIAAGSAEDLQMSNGDVADLSGNGLDDVIFTAQEPGSGRNLDAEAPLYILTRNAGGSLFEGAATLLNGPVPVLSGPGARNVLTADFNGDGRLDLFLDVTGAEPDCGDGSNECFPGGQNRLLLSDNDGKLNDVTDTHLPQYSDYSHGSSVADFDGDGDIDIWVNNAGPIYPTFPYLMHNDGLGNFTVVADLSVPCCDTPIVGRNGILPDGDYGGSLWSIPVDADGDGDMDLQLGRAVDLTNFRQGGEIDYYNRLLLNDGEGRFSIFPGDSYPSIGCGVSPFQPDADACLHDTDPMTQDALVYDLNLDGLDDMLLHQSIWWGDPQTQASTIQILISNGDGTFRDETANRYRAGAVESLGDEFRLHDLDGDGHKDLFSDAFEKDDIRINDGEGFFRPLDDDWVNGVSFRWTVLDVDGDGGTDFLINKVGHEGTTLAKMNLPYGPELTGTGEDDRLIGGARDNVFRGLAGNDFLDSGLGDDELVGGKGSDSLVGGKGRDTYVLSAEDLAGQDNIVDKQGRDTLRFTDFGLERIANTSQDIDGNLLFEFTDGGSLTVVWHFSNKGHEIEMLEAGDCTYRISKDPGFTNGPVQDILGGCILFIGGFEGQ